MKHAVRPGQFARTCRCSPPLRSRSVPGDGPGQRARRNARVRRGLGEVLDDLHQLVDLVPVAARQAEEFLGLGNDCAATRCAGDSDPAPAPELQQSFVAQLPQGPKDSVRVDAENLREIARRRKAFSGLRLTVCDRPTDLRCDLLVQLDGRTTINLDIDCSSRRSKPRATSRRSSPVRKRAARPPAQAFVARPTTTTSGPMRSDEVLSAASPSISTFAMERSFERDKTLESRSSRPRCGTLSPVGCPRRTRRTPR
jgi:hypothetical protein